MPLFHALSHLSPTVALAGLLVGFVVGLTGMGGGALMTPVLIIVFGVHPLTAVSSDLVASLVMKPVGGAVHARRRTVRTDLVKWLAIGSVPAAFMGALLVSFVDAATVGPLVKRAVGIALLASVGSMILRSAVQRRRSLGIDPEPPQLRRWPTLAVGLFGGFVVGLTSVGSGSLIIVMLLFLYPGLRTAELVGTDLVQAIPLVAAAALGHSLFGAVQLSLTGSLLVGAIPAVYLGARLSSRAPDRLVKPALALVLLVSGLKLI
ncbi:MAG: sulfite exporter TauE/SafE family protein [Acidimicrobiales bacterium]